MSAVGLTRTNYNHQVASQQINEKVVLLDDFSNRKSKTQQYKFQTQNHRESLDIHQHKLVNNTGLNIKNILRKLLNPSKPTSALTKTATHKSTSNLPQTVSTSHIATLRSSSQIRFSENVIEFNMSSDLTQKSRISKFKNQAKKSFNRRKTLGGSILAGLLNHKEDNGTLSRSPSTINLPRRDSKFDDFGDSKYSDYINACTPARSPARSESWRNSTLKSANIRKLTTSTSKKDSQKSINDSSSGNSSQDEKTSSETSSEHLEDEIDEGFNIYTSTSTLDIRISTTHRIKTTASPGKKSVRQTLATSEIRQILTKTTHTTNMHTTNFQVPNVPQKNVSAFQMPNNPSKSKFKFTQRRKSLSNNSNNSVESSVSSIPSSSDTAFGSLYDSRSSLGLQNLNFEKVLEDKNSRQTFLQYLMSEHSEEGLLFIIQVRKMEQTVQKDMKSLISFNLKNKAKVVHDMFIKEYSEREVNLCGVTRDLVSARLDAVFGDKISSSRELNEMILKAFKPAKDEITCLLRRDSFPRFLKYLE